MQAIKRKIAYDYFINDQQPSSYLVYFALLLYMEMVLKNKDKLE